MNRTSLPWRQACSLVLVLVFLFNARGEASAAGGKIIYVKAGATGLNNGTSWQNAYRSLQKALSVAAAGDKIWVAKGTYKPTAGTNRYISFVLKENVSLYGGFAGNEMALNQRKPAVNFTILSGDIGQPGVPDDNTDMVVYGESLSSLTIVDGFEITRGQAGIVGGGMALVNASPSLRNLTFRLNRAENQGGGLLNWEGSKPHIVNTTFIGNSAEAGGAMYNKGSSPSLTNVTFVANSASLTGGAVSNFQSSPTLINVTMTGNSAGNSGGAMFNGTASYPNLRNVTISNNTSMYGGAMSNTGDSVPTISNSIVWANNATYGPQFNNAANGSQSLTDSIVQGGCPGGFCANVWDADPMLQPLKNNGGFTKTIALGAGSAAIDAGGLNQPCAAKDQRGVSRPQGGKCDMGAYEVKALSLRSIAAHDGFVLEKGENSGVGGLVNAASSVLLAGDGADNSQVRSIVSFDTAALPDGASVVLARVKLIRASAALLTHGTLRMDLKRPSFGPSAHLESADFQATATVSSAGYLVPSTTDLVYTGELNSTARSSINKSGLTQLRLRFMLDDDDDHVEDVVYLYSGESTIVAKRPLLVIYYNP